LPRSKFPIEWRDKKEDPELYLFKKIVLEKGKVATREFTTYVQVLFNAGKGFDGFNIKKEVKNDLLSCLAPLTVDNCIFFTNNQGRKMIF
jgi:hypothetical protein